MRGVNRFVFVGKIEEIKRDLDEFGRVCFTLKVPEYFAGQVINEVFSLIAWEDLGLFIKENLKFGDLVYLEGRIRYRMKENGYGESVRVYEFHVSKLNLLDEKEV
jgi:single-stranded DNA-binding protein